MIERQIDRPIPIPSDDAGRCLQQQLTELERIRRDSELRKFLSCNSRDRWSSGSMFQATLKEFDIKLSSLDIRLELPLYEAVRVTVESGECALPQFQIWLRMLPGEDNALATSGVDGAVGDHAFVNRPHSPPRGQQLPSMLTGRGFDIHCFEQPDAHHPLLPPYAPGRSGQTTIAANGVTGGASQRLVLLRSPDWPNEKRRPDRDTGTTASS
jgi:hypothetical protein